MKVSLNAFLFASLAIYCSASVTEPTSEGGQALRPNSRRRRTEESPEVEVQQKPKKNKKKKKKKKKKKDKEPKTDAPVAPTSSPVAPTSSPTAQVKRLKACDQQQVIFKNVAVNAADPSFKYVPDADGSYTVKQCKTDDHISGIEDSDGNQLTTTIYGYQQGDGPCTWPGKTFESNTDDVTVVKWRNTIPAGPYIITNLEGKSCIDETLDWAYNIEGFKELTVEEDSVPVVVHLHGTHSEDEFDGHATAFYTPNFAVTGPRFQVQDYFYTNLPGTMWYHDHTHGITMSPSLFRLFSFSKV